MKSYRYYQDLLAYLSNFIPMPDKFADLLYPYLTEPITYNCDYLVFKPEEVADMAYWLIKGYIRTYTEYKPEEDRELWKQVTEDISLPQKIFLLEDSYMRKQPAGCFMEITKGSTVIGLSYSSYALLAAEVPEIANLALQIISAGRTDQQIKNNICKMPGAKSYAAFLDHYSEDVESFIYQMHIASCLGTTAVNLCRIRKNGGYGDDHLRK